MDYRLRLFLTTGSAFGILAGTIFGIPMGISGSLLVADLLNIKASIANLWAPFLLLLIGTILFTGTAAGAGITIWSWVTVEKRIREGKISRNEFDGRVHQRRKITVPFSQKVAYGHCKDALRTLDRSITFDEEVPYEQMTGTTSFSFDSFGEVISIKVKKNGKKTSKVHISSRPKVSSTVADYGKNLSNVNIICEYLGQTDPSQKNAPALSKKTPLKPTYLTE